MFTCAFYFVCCSWFDTVFVTFVCVYMCLLFCMLSVVRHHFLWHLSVFTCTFYTAPVNRWEYWKTSGNSCLGWSSARRELYKVQRYHGYQSSYGGLVISCGFTFDLFWMMMFCVCGGGSVTFFFLLWRVRRELRSFVLLPFGFFWCLSSYADVISE